jgi:predicted nucleic acid-binding protein
MGVVVAARRLLVENRQPLVTTDYVVDEVITLLTVRGQPRTQ